MNAQRSTARRAWRLSLSIVRWWLGLGWAIEGVGGVVSSPFLMSRGDWGGIYMLIGGVTSITLAWLIHPLGRTRQRRRGAD